MKFLRTISVLLAVVFMSLTSMAGENVFSEFADRKDVTTVFISGAMLKMGLLEMVNEDPQMKLIADCIKNPDGIEILSATNMAGNDALLQELTDKINSFNMELVMNTEEGDEKVSIYARSIDEGSVMRDVMITAQEGGEFTVIYIKGEVNIKKLMEFANKQ